MNSSLFGTRLGLLHLRDCKGGCFIGEVYVLEFCGGTYSEV